MSQEDISTQMLSINSKDNRLLLSSFVASVVLYISFVMVILFFLSKKSDTLSIGKKSSTLTNITVLSIIENKLIEPKPIHKNIKKSFEKATIKIKKTSPKKSNPKKTAKQLIQRKQIKYNIAKSDYGISSNKSFQIDDIKAKYYENIKQIITQNKIYPNKALRRNIQGSIKVRFEILDGKLLDIHIIDGKKIFFSSVKSAITNSFPIDTPVNLMGRRLEFDLVMVYKIA